MTGFKTRHFLCKKIKKIFYFLYKKIKKIFLYILKTYVNTK